MIAATLFSGIGAPETAMPSWRWAWSAEIEKFPAAVLSARHPQSVNLGDVTAHDFVERARAVAAPDVLVFGSPCQSFSVAGKRLGLDDPRGNLALLALGIVDRLKPHWFLFENVPGLFSSFSGSELAERAVREGPVGGTGDGEEDRDFAAFLARVSDIGYSLVWSVLDAQHFKLAQRRERVLAVGCLGDWRYPAAVLLEPESLCGDSPPRLQARQDVGGAIGAGSKRSGGRVGRREAAANHIVNTLRGEGHDRGLTGEMGVALIPICESGKRANVKDSPKNGMGIGAPGDPMFTLGTDSRHAIAFGGNDTRGAIDVATAVNAHGGPHGRLDFDSETFVYQCHGTNVGEMGTLRKGDGGVTSGVPFVAQTADTLTAHWERSKGASAGKNQGVVNPIVYPSGVRRLMPVECERLQGYPDGYTAITYRGKPAADGPRYMALGNSMPVPVIAWILRRIEFVDQLRCAA